MKHRHGFTLIEVMVSAAVLGIIMFYLTDMLVQQSRSYEVVDDVNEAQQNLRAIADLMERELRSTGFLVREGGAICGVASCVKAPPLSGLATPGRSGPSRARSRGLEFRESLLGGPSEQADLIRAQFQPVGTGPRVDDQFVEFRHDHFLQVVTTVLDGLRGRRLFCSTITGAVGVDALLE